MSYPIPSAALDDRLAIVGTSGSGKTYAAGTAVERLLSSCARVVIIDPLDVWWGLRVKANGKDPAFPIAIFGGSHADLPITEGAGALLGETVATAEQSCIISLGGMATKSAERRFMLAFLDRLYRKATGEPFHLIFDEADLWAPQKSSEPQLQNLMEQIVRRGRVKGFIPWLITQRPAVISKDVLSQADGLVAMKLTSSQDRDALGAWIEGQADRADEKKMLARLPTLQRGEGIVWIPGRGVLAETKFPAKTTFDSSSTPKRGEVKRSATLKPIDLGRLKEKLASLEEKPAAQKPNTSAVAQQDPRELRAAEDRGRAVGFEDGKRVGYSEGYQKALVEAKAALGAMKPSDPTLIAMPRHVPIPTPRAVAAPAPTSSPTGLTGPQASILRGLRWWADLGKHQPTRPMLAAIVGMSHGSGHFNNVLGSLRGAGLIDYPSGGLVSLTDQGSAVAPHSGERGRAFDIVRRSLNGPQQKIIDAISDGREISRDDLAAATGMSAGSGHFNNILGSLRTMEVIDYPAKGCVQLCRWMWDLAA